MYHGAGERESPPLPPAQLGDEPVLQLPVLELKHAEEARDLCLEGNSIEHILARVLIGKISHLSFGLRLRLSTLLYQ